MIQLDDKRPPLWGPAARMQKRTGGEICKEGEATNRGRKQAADAPACTQQQCHPYWGEQQQNQVDFPP